MLVPTRPWENLLGRYRDLEGRHGCFEPMRRLVEHVAGQPYATLLFATTSMHALLVAQHPQIEWGHDVLRIEVITDAGGVRFTYHEQQGVSSATWECAGGAIVDTFEGFLRSSHWIVLPVPAK